MSSFMQRPRSPDGTADEVEIVQLHQLSRHDLGIRWRQIHRDTPPQCLSRDLLIRFIAYGMQERVHGGLPAAVKRRLRVLTTATGSESDGVDPAPVLKPGARLIREWNGRVHTVIVIKDGFEYQGEPYRSLTQIAKQITGAHWSGPRFFGLRQGVRISDG